MPVDETTQSSIDTDDAFAEPFHAPHTVIIFGEHRLPIAVESVVCDTDDQAMHLAHTLAASHPDCYGYEMWFNGRKLVAYFSQTVLNQNGHTHEAAQLRYR